MQAITEIPTDIVEVRRALSEADANELINKGWLLLAVSSGHELVGPETVVPKFGYCLGLPGTVRLKECLRQENNKES